MTANTLFDEVLESLVAEGGKVEKRNLNVVLERDVSGRELSLSLKISDSARPLFLLVFECGPGQYAELREKQRLKVEFNSFPVKLAGLLRECSAESQREPRLEVWVEEVENVGWCLCHNHFQHEPVSPIEPNQHLRPGGHEAILHLGAERVQDAQTSKSGRQGG